MPFSTYLFDLDGTLIDSVELILASFHHTRHVHFGDRLPDDVYLATMGTPLREAFRLMVDTQEAVDEMVRTYVDFNLSQHDRMVRPYPGVMTMLGELRERGARVGIVTSKMNEHAWRGLRVASMNNVVDVLVGADDVSHGKPHPAPVHRALEVLGASPDDTVFAGDSPHDIEAGNRAGVASAAALWGPFSRPVLEAAGPRYWLPRPQDILAL